jgi:hypothetical protein
VSEQNKAYRVSIVVDVYGDAYKAGRVYAALSEAAGKLDADEQTFEVEWIGEGSIEDPGRPPLDCWCGAPAQCASPTVPFDGTWQPVCIEHTSECSEVVHLDDLSEDELNEKLGLA